MKRKPKSDTLIRVLCEGCIRAHHEACPACRGTRFYLWNPQTLECFFEDGTPIVTEKNGERLPVVRRGLSLEHNPIPVETMIECLELWISESPLRKWNVTVDEEGWQSCLWFNRYKRSCFQTSDRSFARCVAQTFHEVFRSYPSSS